MAGLTKTKTYAAKALIYTGALSAADGNKEGFWQVKEALLYGTDGIKGGTYAWNVLGSSDGSTAGLDTTDRWTDRTKIVQAAAGVAHSWVVLQNPDIGASTGYFQFCIDCNSATTSTGSVIMSVGAGFTGGSTTARPTATDEIVLASAVVLFNAVACNGSQGVQCIKSTDGKVTRLIWSRDGITYRSCWLFEALRNVESYWTSDVVAGVVIPLVSTATGALAATASAIFSSQGGNHSGRVTCLGTLANPLVSASTTCKTTQPDVGGDWALFPCGFVIDTGTNKGRIGDFYDLWLAPTTVPQTSYFSGSGGGSFQFVVVGNLVLPWVGTRFVLP